MKKEENVSQSPLNRSTPQPLNQKKPGGKSKFSSRVEVIGWNYEKPP